MASGKKGAKGNKTAHVLNLLTAPGEASPAPAGETAGDAPAQEAAQPAGRPLLPPILEVAQANDDQLAQQIQQALEEELAPSAVEEAPEPTPSKEATPVADSTPASGGKMSQDDIEKMLASMGTPAEAPAPPAPEPPAPSGGKMSQDDIEKMLASMGAPAEAPAPPAPEPPAPSGGKISQDDIEKMLASMGTPAETPPPPAPEPPAPENGATTDLFQEDEDISYVNVMQTLVEEKALRYIKMFGLCTCKRCQADVKALTLSNLVPKYVVMSKADSIPMLTVYEGRFNSTIIAQLTRSCKTVMDHPHHKK